MKVKILYNASCRLLEEEINEFLKTSVGKLIDIKYWTTEDERNHFDSVLIIYEEISPSLMRDHKEFEIENEQLFEALQEINEHRRFRESLGAYIDGNLSVMPEWPKKPCCK